MFRNDGTCWVILAKMPGEDLQRTISAYFEETGAARDSSGPAVEVAEGASLWSLAVSRNPDHDGLESAIGRQVSEAVAEPVFVLPYCDEDHGAPGAQEYRAGDELDRHDVDYDRFLGEHGCSLPPDAPYVPVRTDRYRRASVFVDATELGGIQSYLQRWDPNHRPVQFETSRAGLPMLRWQGGAPWGYLAEDVGQPSLRIIEVTNDLRTGQLAVDVYEGGRVRTLGSAPPGEGPESYVTSIKGASTPEGVIDALGIPREALGLT